MKTLQIIKTAYRATIEEQDDTIVWLTHAMTGAGGDFDVLLGGSCVNYTVKHQTVEGLTFGNWKQTSPPKLARDIAGLVEKGVDVYVLEEDVRDYGIDSNEQIEGIKTVARSGLAKLVDQYDLIWRW